MRSSDAARSQLPDLERWAEAHAGPVVWFKDTFTGRSMAQEFGKGWAEGVHRDDFDGCLNIYVSHFEARQGFRMQYRLRRYDGAYRWIDDTGIPRYARDGKFLGYIGSCIDIHEHRQTQAELHRRLLEFVHLNRQADAAAMAASIAHELNQPLAAILSNSEAAEALLAANPPALGEVKEMLADMGLSFGLKLENFPPREELERRRIQKEKESA